MASPNDLPHKVLAYRLDIDPEFQGWILAFCTITAIWLFCLPCYCAGMSCISARKFAAWISQRLPQFYCIMLLFNMTFIYLVIQWLPDYTFPQYIHSILKMGVFLFDHVLKWATSIVIIVAFCIAVAFKDRFLLMMGLDHKVLFKCKVRDCLFCWTGSRFKPIEVVIWKVEDLPAADLFTANNVFVEFCLGYNEPMHTRVHNNAGSSCILKETMQLNFDEDDDEEKLFIFVRNQQVMGAPELARVEIQPEKLKQMVDQAKSFVNQPIRWDNSYFTEPIQLVPRGRLWLRAAPFIEEAYSAGSYVEDLTTC